MKENRTNGRAQAERRAPEREQNDHPAEAPQNLTRLRIDTGRERPGRSHACGVRSGHQAPPRVAAGDDDNASGVARLEQSKAHRVAPGAEHAFSQAVTFVHDPQPILVLGDFEGAVTVDDRSKMYGVAHSAMLQRLDVGAPAMAAVVVPGSWQPMISDVWLASATLRVRAR